MLRRRLDRDHRFERLRALPVVSELGRVRRGPFPQSRNARGGNEPLMDPTRGQLDLGDVLAVLRVQVRRVIGPIHPDRDPVRPLPETRMTRGVAGHGSGYAARRTQRGGRKRWCAAADRSIALARSRPCPRSAPSGMEGSGVRVPRLGLAGGSPAERLGLDSADAHPQLGITPRPSAESDLSDSLVTCLV